MIFRTVASSLSELGESVGSYASGNTDMTDVDMASMAEEELGEKFSVQGTSTRSSGGIKKVVSNRDDHIFLAHIYKLLLFRLLKTLNS